jgi:hypothetical protein
VKILHQLHLPSFHQLILQKEIELEIVDGLDTHRSRSSSYSWVRTMKVAAAACVGANVNVLFANEACSFAECRSGGWENGSTRDCSSESIGS